MINISDINQISTLLNGEKIIKYKLISNSFNINCVKLYLSNKQILIAKYYSKKNKEFNAILSEKKNLKYLAEKNINYFPKIIFGNEKYLITEYIENNNKKPKKTNLDFLKAVINIHSFSNNSYGFRFDTQIGGVKHQNKYEKNWAEFYSNTRLNYFFDLANKNNLLNKSTRTKIDKVIKQIKNLLPNNPKPTLMHGDLWEGNILFKDYKFVSFIDPGSFYGHNEMEIAYLRWFKPVFIDDNFLLKYKEYIPIDKNYFNYEPVYQLYYALCNVVLWDKSYVIEVNNLLNKIKI
tara:strand:+ start:5773 stop:6648 length:876 start_codon:yes stop_codon:yes gene_type:complete